MPTLPTTETSFWEASSDDPGYPKLASNLEMDVAVIGGGIAGMTTAYLLKQAGLKVAVIDKAKIGSGVTGHTTGKVTSQHNLIYTELKQRLGKSVAQSYGEANQAAIDQIETIITQSTIACDWQREDNYVFTEDYQEVSKLKKESEVAHSLGLPATFETSTPLPFSVQAAVRFSHQAKIHARKYILGLAKAVDGGGSHIFENTKVQHLRDGQVGLVKAEGYTIKAKDLVIATNVPFPIPTHVAYAAFEYPMKSYIVAARRDFDLPGMYISSGKSSHSILPVSVGGQKLLLVGGEGHFYSLGGRKEKHYERLARYSQERFNIGKIDYSWGARDYLAYDSLPLIGKLFPWSKHVYVATGFMKWGLTNGTVAGMVLSDMILGKPNHLVKTFDPGRLSTVTSIPHAMIKFFK